MVDPDKGFPLVQQAEQILLTHGFRHEIRHKSQAQRAREARAHCAREAG